MSAPGSLAIAKIMYPELERSKFEQTVAISKVKDRKHNLFYAILEGLFQYALNDDVGDVGDRIQIRSHRHLQFVTNRDRRLYTPRIVYIFISYFVSNHNYFSKWPINKW